MSNMELTSGLGGNRISSDDFREKLPKADLFKEERDLAHLAFKTARMAVARLGAVEADSAVLVASAAMRQFEEAVASFDQTFDEVKGTPITIVGYDALIEFGTHFEYLTTRDVGGGSGFAIYGKFNGLSIANTHHKPVNDRYLSYIVKDRLEAAIEVVPNREDALWERALIIIDSDSSKLGEIETYPDPTYATWSAVH